TAAQSTGDLAANVSFCRVKLEQEFATVAGKFFLYDHKILFVLGDEYFRPGHVMLEMADNGCIYKSILGREPRSLLDFVSTHDNRRISRRNGGDSNDAVNRGLEPPAILLRAID